MQTSSVLRGASWTNAGTHLSCQPIGTYYDTTPALPATELSDPGRDAIDPFPPNGADKTLVRLRRIYLKERSTSARLEPLVQVMPALMSRTWPTAVRIRQPGCRAATAKRGVF